MDLLATTLELVLATEADRGVFAARVGSGHSEVFGLDAMDGRGMATNLSVVSAQGSPWSGR